MLGRSFSLALVAALAVVTWGGVARAQIDEQSELDKAKNAYLARQYDEAETRFSSLLDPKNPVLHDRVLSNQARMYWGAVLIAKGRAVDAGREFEELLLNDPTYEPDPLAFPTDVVNTFIDARSRIRARLNQIAHQKALEEAERRRQEEEAKRRQAARLQKLEQMAGEEKTVVQHSRWIAMVPFGAGQFQNGQRSLGAAFLGVEAALAVAAAIMLPVYLLDLEYESNAYSNRNVGATNAYRERAASVRFANIGLDISFASVAALGIAQAQIAYVPEEAHVIHRPLPEVTPPPAPSVSLRLSPVLPGEGRGAGVTFGLSGRF